jgi:hypothetical protein
MNRDELEQQLRELIIGCPGGNEEMCPFCHCSCDSDVAAAMKLIDRYVTAAVEEAAKADTAEAWNAAETAEYLGYRDAAAARSALSRWGIKRSRERQDENSGRMIALYPADAIRAEAVRRGRRT